MDCKELELAGIHVPELMDRLMNNASLMRMIVGKFLDDRSYAKLQEAIAEGERKAAEFSCHSLKGVCGNLALKKLYELTQQQLALFRGGDYDAAVDMMGAITAEYDNAAHHIQLWLDQQQ